MSQTANQTPNPQSNEPSRLKEFLLWLRGVVLNNWPMKLLSLALAVALWAGLITQDPTLTREKIFRDVSVAVNNADILKRNGYVVTSDLNALLADVDMVVNVPQMQYAEAQPTNYNIRVDLNRLEKRAGEQTLTIQTTSTNTYGTVTRVSPASVTVMVEEYVTHNYIPVNVVQTGEVPAGYYATGVTRDPAWVTVSGPRSLVEQVDRAEVVMDMGDLPAREGTVERSLTFTLVNEDGQPIESDMLEVTRESVLRERINITATLYTRRDIEVLSAQLYQGEPAEGYEVTDVYITPAYVTVVGQKSVVDSVNLLQTSRLVNIAGAKDTVTASVDLSKPLNLQWMSASKVAVTVVIQPKKDTVLSVDVPLTIVGLPSDLSAEPAQSTVTVRITGNREWVEGLTADDLTVICDVTGLEAGVCDIPLQCTVAGSDGQEYVLETEPQTMRVSLAGNAGE